MITLPNGKICMNEQEAIAWLLDNYPIPFQCSANYAAGTEIGLGTIVNPTPAKVKVGSIIFFADSKVSTVVGLTANGFICSDQYNDLVDDVVYVSDVQLNASGHLIVTLSNGTNIDAGLIKQVSSFSVNASQHLIANYNDGTSTDLGAIFNGDINISGTLTAQNLKSNNRIARITGDYNITPYMNIYAGWPSAIVPSIYFAKGTTSNGKLNIVVCVKLTVSENIETSQKYIASVAFTSIPIELSQSVYVSDGTTGAGVIRTGATSVVRVTSYNPAILGEASWYLEKESITDNTFRINFVFNIPAANYQAGEYLLTQEINLVL